MIMTEEFPIDYKIKCDMTALMVAASECETRDAVCAILVRPQDINKTDLIGRTALHYACDGGKSKNVEALLAF